MRDDLFWLSLVTGPEIADVFGDLQALVTKVLQPDELAASFQAAGPEIETQLHAALVWYQAYHFIAYHQSAL